MRLQQAPQARGEQVMVRQGGAQQGGSRQVFMVNKNGEAQEAAGGAAQSGQGGAGTTEGKEREVTRKRRTGREVRKG